VVGDAGKVVEVNNTAIAKITIPPDVFAVGDKIEIHRYGPNFVNLGAGAGVTLHAPNGLLGIKDRYGSVIARCRATNEFEITGSGDVGPFYDSYQAMILGTPGLQSYWRMNEASGTFVDQKGVIALASPSGSGFTRNDTGLIVGDSNGAFRVGAVTGGSTTATDLYRFSGVVPFTVELIAIAYGGTAGVSASSIFRSTNFSTDNWSIYFDTSTATDCRFGIRRGGTSFAEAAFQNGLIGVKHHLAIVYDGTNVKLYRDGVVTVNAASGTFTAPTGCSLWMGGGSGQDKKIDEIAIYNVALDAATIAARVTAMG
jgi:hypothetical protein